MSKFDMGSSRNKNGVPKKERGEEKKVENLGQVRIKVILVGVLARVKTWLFCQPSMWLTYVHVNVVWDRWYIDSKVPQYRTLQCPQLNLGNSRSHLDLSQHSHAQPTRRINVVLQESQARVTQDIKQPFRACSKPSTIPLMSSVYFTRHETKWQLNPSFTSGLLGWDAEQWETYSFPLSFSSESL